MLRAYYDGAGKSTNSNDSMVTIGGVVSSLDRWELFELEWKVMLSDFGVSELHMKFLNGFKREYKGWDETKRRAFLAKAIEIMNRHCEGYTAVTMPLYVFRNLEEQQQSTLIDPFFPCFFACLEGMMICTKNLTPNEKFELVFADEPGCMGKLDEYWKKCNSADAPEDLKSSLGTFTHGKPKDIFPLQAADLVAYEVNKYISEELLFRTRKKPLPTIWPRWTFEQLRKDQRMLVIEAIDREGIRNRFGI